MNFSFTQYKWQLNDGIEYKILQYNRHNNSAFNNFKSTWERS